MHRIEASLQGQLLGDRKLFSCYVLISILSLFNLLCTLQILMIRLHSYKYVDCSILLSWLELLHNYFQELLQHPLSQFQSDQDPCLEGSPFLLSLSDGEVSGMHSSHLQRQAIFLFLDCSFSLISQKGDPTDRRICPTLNSCLTNDSDSEPDHYCRKKGLLELYKWLQGHLPSEISINPEKYLDICVNFMSSFLQLYLGEVCLLTPLLLLVYNVVLVLSLFGAAIVLKTYILF